MLSSIQNYVYLGWRSGSHRSVALGIRQGYATPDRCFHHRRVSATPTAPTPSKAGLIVDKWGSLTAFDSDVSGWNSPTPVDQVWSHRALTNGCTHDQLSVWVHTQHQVNLTRYCSGWTRSTPTQPFLDDPYRVLAGWPLDFRPGGITPNAEGWVLSWPAFDMARGSASSAPDWPPLTSITCWIKHQPPYQESSMTAPNPNLWVPPWELRKLPNITEH